MTGVKITNNKMANMNYPLGRRAFMQDWSDFIIFLALGFLLFFFLLGPAQASIEKAERQSLHLLEEERAELALLQYLKYPVDERLTIADMIIRAADNEALLGEKTREFLESAESPLLGIVLQTGNSRQEIYFLIPSEGTVPLAEVAIGSGGEVPGREQITIHGYGIPKSGEKPPAYERTIT